MIPVRTMNSAPDWQRRHEAVTIPSWSAGTRWMFALAVLLGLVLSLLVPPLKFADEIDHIKRAYFLSQGQVLLYAQPCTEEGPFCKGGTSMSGGMLDRGLSEYLVMNNHVRRTSESVLGEQRSDSIRWRGEHVFEPAAGTSYYFPFVYAPQAAGLAAGKALGFNVDDSYRLARLAAFASGMIVLALAFFIHRPPVIVLALLLLPMGLFQAVSASIDFFATALAVLAICCFMRAVTQGRQSSMGLAVLMALCVFVVGASRAHLTPMVLLLFVSAWFAAHRLWWVLGAIVTVAILVWMAVVIPDTVDFRIQRSVSTLEAAAHYLKNPVELAHVFYNTLTNGSLLGFYLASFHGVFLNLPLPIIAYLILSALLGGMVLFSLAHPAQWRMQALPRLTLIACGLISSVLAFLAMLITWTPVPTNVIQGVQGRYLLVPVMLACLGVCSWRPATGVRQGIVNSLLFLLLACAVLFSVQRMLSGYYQPLAVASPVPTERVAAQSHALPSPAISMGNPVKFALASGARSFGNPEWIGLQMGTGHHPLQGRARLQFEGKDGARQTVDVDLSRAEDGEYLYVKMPQTGWYDQLTVSVVEGTASFIIWATPEGEPADELKACAVFVPANGVPVYTAGCSVPR